MSSASAAKTANSLAMERAASRDFVIGADRSCRPLAFPCGAFRRRVRPYCGVAPHRKDRRSGGCTPPQGRPNSHEQKFTLNVNGVDRTVEADPDTPLLYVLRDDLGLNNPHFGCGLGQCGACTVQLDGKPAHSCRRPISTVGDKKVVTLAGLGTPEHPHPLQAAYVRGASAAMRLLHQRLDHDRRGLPARQQEADRRANSRRAHRTSSAAAAPTWPSCAPSSAPPR